MNKLTKKQIFLVVAAAITVPLPLCGLMDGFKEKTYKLVEKPAIYNAGVYIIDKSAQLLSNTIVRLSRLTHKQATALQKVDHRLKSD
ncbi:MAG TPA: hypothetical protein VKR54_04495 [Candidatus Babeliales bacterium]|jgi:hypothetical protein|nr:hypothetical protein [Candidatus Babeliales bacterium]